MDERITGSALQDGVLRGQAMKTPDDVAAMMRLKSLGWGAKRIARELGCSHHTVKGYLAASGARPFKSPQRPKLLEGHDDWLRKRFIRHRGNADVVRQDLLSEKGLAVSRRTLQRALPAVSAGVEGGGAGKRALRDGAGPAAADRLRRAAGRDRGQPGESVRVRGDARLLAASACARVPQREAGALVRRARERVQELRRFRSSPSCAPGRAHRRVG
jgi:hypothetical protein